MSILTEREDNSLEIEGMGSYTITCTFDQVLRWLRFIKERQASEEVLLWGYNHFIQDPPDLPTEDQLQIVEEIVDHYISPFQDNEDIEEQESDDVPQPQFYDFDVDADLIYASFLQDYHIDLVKEIGRMSWRRFVALLNGLRDDTKFKQVVAIRREPLPAGNEPETIRARNELSDLKELYKLDTPENEAYEQYKLTQSFISLRQKTKEMRS